MLKVYNTLTGKKEEFKPLEKGKVKIYVCGLTVQNYSHLGHIRSAINYDVIRRYLEYKGYEVIYVQNFTDINEKIVNRAKEEGVTTEELADKYTKAYLEDIDNLNVKRASIYVKATEHIDEIVEMIKTLIQKGFAYEVNGNVYFSVEKFKDYGKLSGRSLDELQAGARIEIVKEKRNPLDFALWKQAPEGEISWDTPWGKGWPGWHIECSAMSIKYLGESFDIHGGGSDLIFPHHENEIAQSEAYSGKPFVKYWLHNGTVNLQGEKMSKSLGNFYSCRDLLEKYRGEELRFFLLTRHYHTPIDFSFAEMEKTNISLNKLIKTNERMKKLLASEEFYLDKTKGSSFTEIKDIYRLRREEFEKAMDDDFNSARAIGVLHDLSRDINGFINDIQFNLDKEKQILVREGFNLFHKLGGILGLTLKREEENEKNDLKITKDLLDLILEVREEARKEKNWHLADKIRDRLDGVGFIIKDTPRGAEWERKSD